MADACGGWTGVEMGPFFNMLSLALFYTETYFTFDHRDVVDHIPRGVMYAHFRNSTTLITYFDRAIHGEEGRGVRHANSEQPQPASL